MRIINFCFLTIFSAGAVLADPISFQVNPAPLVGNNGVYGWGFSLINDTGSYLSVDSVQLASPVDDPGFRFGPASNFTELFATFQFNPSNILIVPNSTYTLGYNGSDQGLATWAFPDGFGTYGNLASNVFQIQIGYSLWADNAYGSFVTSGVANADAQLQFGATTAVPEPGSWLLLGPALAFAVLRLMSATRRSVIG